MAWASASAWREAVPAAAVRAPAVVGGAVVGGGAAVVGGVVVSGGAIVVVVVEELVVVDELGGVDADLLSDEHEPTGSNTTRPANTPTVICAVRGHAAIRRNASLRLPD